MIELIPQSFEVRGKAYRQKKIVGFEAQYIRPEMRLATPNTMPSNECFTICICLGGFSPLNKVGLVIAQLALLDAKSLHIVLIKSFDSNFDHLTKLFDFSKNVTIDYKHNIDSVIKDDFYVDLFIIGGGFLKFEMLNLGESFLIFPVIDHQKKLVDKFERLVGMEVEFNRVMAQVKSVGELKSLLHYQKKNLSRFKNFFSKECFFSRLGF